MIEDVDPSERTPREDGRGKRWGRESRRDVASAIDRREIEGFVLDVGDRRDRRLDEVEDRDRPGKRLSRCAVIDDLDRDVVKVLGIDRGSERDRGTRRPARRSAARRRRTVPAIERRSTRLDDRRSPPTGTEIPHPDGLDDRLDSTTIPTRSGRDRPEPPLPRAPPWGVPTPPISLHSPVFFDPPYCRCGQLECGFRSPRVGRSRELPPRCARWAGALASLGCPQGIRVALATCLLCACCAFQVTAGLCSPVGSPTPNQLPDLDDVHSFRFISAAPSTYA